MNSVIYARVSSKEQEQEGYSIPAQLKLLNDYALKSGYKVVKEFVDVETAKRAGRENFNLMIEFLKKNTDIKAILCEKTDRLSRNFRDIATLDDLINQQNIRIILVKENTVISRDSKSHEKFIFGIKALMAKNYIDNLSEETRKGMLEKAEQGIYPSCAPLGYKNCEAKQDGRVFKYLDVDEQRAPIIQKLFRMYATGNYSLATLAKQAYEEGLRNKRGGKVGKAAIHHILQNPIYYGVFKWNGKSYKGNHPPLVSKELFDVVQEALKQHNRPKQTKRDFAFVGLLTCGKCGCNITAEIKKDRYVYYHCTFSKGRCENTYIREDRLAEKLGDIVKNIYIDSQILEWIIEALKESHKDEKEYHDSQIQALNEQYSRLQNRIDKIYEDKLDGKITEDFWLEKYNQYRQEQENIELALERHKNANINYIDSAIKILELSQRAHSLYLKQNFKEKAKLIRILTSNCTLLNGTLYPTYRKPFDIIAKGLTRQNWLPREDSNLGPGGYK